MGLPATVVGRLVDAIRSLRGHYHSCFHTTAGRAVLTDLAKFCRATETCVVTPGGRDGRIPIDRDRTLVLEGRREVWLHIQQYLGLKSSELFHIYNPFETSEDDDG